MCAPDAGQGNAFPVPYIPSIAIAQNRIKKKKKEKKKKYIYIPISVYINTYISAIRTIFFGVVSIAQSVEVTDSAVLGGVAEVVSSNPRWAIKIFFSIFRHS